jgi:hypothetical protein
MRNNLIRFAGVALLGIGVSSVGFGAAVPEIDPATGGSAIALLGGVLLMIRGRRRS